MTIIIISPFLSPLPFIKQNSKVRLLETREVLFVQKTRVKLCLERVTEDEYS